MVLPQTLPNYNPAYKKESAPPLLQFLLNTQLHVFFLRVEFPLTSYRVTCVYRSRPLN